MLFVPFLCLESRSSPVSWTGPWVRSCSNDTRELVENLGSRLAEGYRVHYIVISNAQDARMTMLRGQMSDPFRFRRFMHPYHVVECRAAKSPGCMQAFSHRLKRYIYSLSECPAPQKAPYRVRVDEHEPVQNQTVAKSHGSPDSPV